MIADFHNLQFSLLCQLSKSTPNILWSVGSSLHNQFLQVGRGNPAVMVARLSINSMLGRHAGKMPPPDVCSALAACADKVLPKSGRAAP